MSVVSFDILHGLMIGWGWAMSAGSCAVPDRLRIPTGGVASPRRSRRRTDSSAASGRPSVFHGDTLFLASDGIRGEFALEQAPSECHTARRKSFSRGLQRK